MTEQSPTVSVIAPNHPYENTLRTVLESVCAQTPTPLEVVVAGDCSADHCRAIAEELPGGLVRARREGGGCATRDLGVDAGSGEILYFVDSDAVLAPAAIANAVDLMLSDPATGWERGSRC